MTVSGGYVKGFEGANMAMVSGINMDADYPHWCFEVVEVVKALFDVSEVVLKSMQTGEVIRLKVRRSDISKHEHAVIKMSSSFEKLTDRPPASFRINPFKGKVS